MGENATTQGGRHGKVGQLSEHTASDESENAGSDAAVGGAAERAETADTLDFRAATGRDDGPRSTRPRGPEGCAVLGTVHFVNPGRDRHDEEEQP